MPSRKTYGAKLDDQLANHLINRCQTKGCRPSDYLKDLIKRDLARPYQSEMPAAEGVAAKAVAVASQPRKASTYVPPYVVRYRCLACVGDQLHENENYQGPPVGKCDSCHEKFVHKALGKCQFCRHGEIEPLGPEDIEEMGLYSK